MKEERQKLSFNSQSIDNLKLELVNSFEEWYLKTFEDPSANDDLQSTMHFRSLTRRSTAENELVEREDESEHGVDPDALAFIKAKRNVVDLHKAKKAERTGKA
jgi:hypothetical protein